MLGFQGAKFVLKNIFFMIFNLAGPLAHIEIFCFLLDFFHGLYFGWPTGPLAHNRSEKVFKLNFFMVFILAGPLAHWPKREVKKF